MKRKLSKTTGTMVALLMLVAMLGCISEEEKETPAPTATVKVGCVYPLTGNMASRGVASRQAVELAADIVNNKYPDLNLPLAASEGLPNLGGTKIELVWADTRGTAEEGRSATEYLIINEEVDVLMGCYQSAVTETASVAAEHYKVPFLNPDSAAASLTERGFEYFWRSSPIVTTWTQNIIDFYKDVNIKYGAGTLQTLGIFNEDSLWGMEASDWVLQKAQAAGFILVERITYSRDSADLSAEVLRMEQADPDWVFMGSYVSDSILYIKTMKEYGWLPKAAIGSENMAANEVVSTAGEDLEYFLALCLFPQDIASVRELTAEINDMAMEKYGTVFDDPAARAFTGLLLIADAVNRAGSKDKEAINAAFATTNIPGEQLILLWENISFDEKHQLKAGRYAIQQYLNGEWKTVWPWDSATATFVIPMPEWDER